MAAMYTAGVSLGRGKQDELPLRGAAPHIFDKLPQPLLVIVYANESGVQLRLP